MYVVGPPTRDDAAGGRLRISSLARRRFDSPPSIAGHPGHHAHLHAYLSDLVRPYQLSLPEHLNGAGHSYGEMASALVGELAADGEPVDLVVLAFGIPDVRPGRATATYLSERCPGSPLAFAICDQGAAAAFTGLRLVEEYARSGGCRRALLLVVEQAALPYDAGLPVDVPVGHTAVGLRCEAAGPARLSSVRQHADVGPERVAGLLTEELATAAAGHPDVSVIADAHLADRVTAVSASRMRTVPPGRPHTGGWWELADVLRLDGAPPGPAAPSPAGRRVVLASYDRPLRYLCLSTIDVTPERSGRGHG
jgi:4-hydroxymandelate oxidase